MEQEVREENMQSPRNRILTIVASLLAVCSVCPAQDSLSPTPTAAPPAEVRVDSLAQPGASEAVPSAITFQDALKLAQKNSPTFRAALTD